MDSQDNTDQEAYIEVVMQYDEETHVNFIRFILIRVKKRNAYIIYMGTIGFFFLLSTAQAIWERDATKVLHPVIFVIMFIYFLYRGTIMPRKSYRRSKSLYEGETVYRFFPDRIETIGENAVTAGASTLKYTALDRVYKTREAYYLQLISKGIRVVKRTDISSGQEARLDELFRKNFEKTFILL